MNEMNDSTTSKNVFSRRGCLQCVLTHAGIEQTEQNVQPWMASQKASSKSKKKWYRWANTQAVLMVFSMVALTVA